MEKTKIRFWQVRCVRRPDGKDFEGHGSCVEEYVDQEEAAMACDRMNAANPRASVGYLVFACSASL